MDTSIMTGEGWEMSTKTGEAYLLEEAPWACMLSNAEGPRLLGTMGEQRIHSLLCTHYGKALHNLGDRAAAESHPPNRR
jgi:hypothetical protein